MIRAIPSVQTAPTAEILIVLLSRAWNILNWILRRAAIKTWSVPKVHSTVACLGGTRSLSRCRSVSKNCPEQQFDMLMCCRSWCFCCPLLLPLEHRKLPGTQPVTLVHLAQYSCLHSQSVALQGFRQESLPGLPVDARNWTSVLLNSKADGLPSSCNTSHCYH